MSRWVKGPQFDKRAAKRLTRKDRERLARALEQLSSDPPGRGLRLRKMEGYADLWEMRAGGQNRVILRRARDALGDLFVVEDVGRHDNYKKY